MNVVKEIENITNLELEHGIIGGITNGSWHDKYKNSAWVYVGGLSYELTEGDIICVMSQWGEIEDVNLIREKSTGKSMGYAFVKYEDQRSTILAVDNFNGVKLLGRVVRCDHVEQYRLPKEVREKAEELLEVDPTADLNIGPGHAYKGKHLENKFDISTGVDIWAPVTNSDANNHSDERRNIYEDESQTGSKYLKKHKHKHKHKHKKYLRGHKSNGDDNSIHDNDNSKYLIKDSDYHDKNVSQTKLSTSSDPIRLKEGEFD
jgi:RNA-binding motif X-linked protein 2